jgi:YHS domain-containing protein
MRPGGGAMATATDPVCGMDVDVESPPGGTYVYEGVTYYFCATGCKDDFAEDPDSYLSK